MSGSLLRRSKRAAQVAAAAARARRGRSNPLGLGCRFWCGRGLGLGLGLAIIVSIASASAAAAAGTESKSKASQTTNNASGPASSGAAAAGAESKSKASPRAENAGGSVSSGAREKAAGTDAEASKLAELRAAEGKAEKRVFPITLTPRGQIFVRGQGRFNSKFDPQRGDREVAVLQRIRLGLLAEKGPVKAYVEVQDVRKWGFERSTIANSANLDLHQGYLELGLARGERSGHLRLGRQEIQVGSRRLLVDANWNPLGRSYDALRVVGASGMFSLDAGLMMLAPPSAFSVADASEDPELAVQVQSRGSYSAYMQFAVEISPALNIEGLALGISERPTAKLPTVERDIFNGGFRMHGRPAPGLTYDIEAYGQAGRELGLKQRAWAAFSTLIYTFKAKLRPGLNLRYNYASGQACTGSPEEGCGNQQSGEFFRFFGLKHARYGIADRVAHSNLRELEAGAQLAPHSTLKLNLSYHFFQLDEPTGRWRNTKGALVGAGWDATNTSRNLANEVDLLVTYRPWKPLFVQLGYGLFMPLEAARRLAGSAPQHFAFLWVIARL